MALCEALWRWAKEEERRQESEEAALVLCVALVAKVLAGPAERRRDERRQSEGGGSLCPDLCVPRSSIDLSSHVSCVSVPMQRLQKKHERFIYRVLCFYDFSIFVLPYQ